MNKHNDRATRPVVEVVGLRKEFGSSPPTVAIDSVTFTLAEGGALAIVGESGSGKSTTARCVVGLEAPTGGTVTVCGRGRAPGRVSLRERRARAREIQMVFQDPYSSLNPRLSVHDSIRSALALREGIRPSRVDGRSVTELLDTVELAARLADIYPRQLSGGQRQRLAIARSLAAQPQVLVLDEAVAALDVSVQAQILNLLTDIRRQRGLSYLFITHDLNVVRQVSEHVIVMQRGQIVERGTTAAVLDDPTHPHTAHLIAAVPRPGWKPRTITNTTDS